MTGDAAALISEARALLSRLQRQEARFLHGRTRGTRGRGRTSAGACFSGTRKKEGYGLLRETNRRKAINRPSYLCAPQCTRRAVPCRSNHSTHSLRLLSSKSRHFPLTRGATTLTARDEPDVESILDSERPDDAAVQSHPRKMATAIAPSRVASSRNLEEAASNVSVNTFVAIQVRNIMEKAAHNMANTMGSGAREAGDTADAARVKALRHQVMRAATYTAVCRRLEHALHLYNETSPYKAPRRESQSENLDLAKRQEIRSEATISDLPKNTLLAIFSLLDQRELSLNVAPVCRLWHQLAYHSSLWRHLLLDWTSEKDAGLSRVAATCALLAATPGLLKLELVGCPNVDWLLWQVVRSCQCLRTLAVDSCMVSEHLRTNLDNAPCVLSEVLTKCRHLHSLIVAFTPYLAQSVFFTNLGKRCWSMRCFLVSADVANTRIFFESASWHAPGRRSKEAVGGARAAILPSSTNSVHRVTDIQTENSSPSAGSTLLQWRLHRDHADATYFGVNVRVGLANSI